MPDRKLASSNRDHLRLKNGCHLLHWPEKLYDDKLKIITCCDNDRNHAKRFTDLLLKLGGPEAAGAKDGGVYWHVSRGHSVIYMSEGGEREDHSIMQIMGQSI